MRITGGTARGIPLDVPRGDAVRPATDALRQAVFSSIAAQVPGAWFLDLCAGSGAYGLEALSRGASGGVFVEKSAKAVACLRANIAAVCKSARHDPRTLAISQCDLASWTPAKKSSTSSQPLASVIPQSAIRIPHSEAPELIFIDPPYKLIPRLAPIFFAKTAEWLAASKAPLIVFEMPAETTLDAPAGWTIARRLGGKSARQPTAVIYARER